MQKLLTALLVAILLMLAACDSSSDPTATPTPTEQPTLLPTPEPTEELDITEEPAVTAEPDVEFFSDGYGISVSVTNTDNFNPNMAAPPEGSKWVELTATLSNENESGDAITVSQDDLHLIDEEGNRYSPEEPDEFSQPPLVGAEINQDEFLNGFVRFAIPEDAVPARLEWCLDESCQQAIQSFVNIS